MTSGKTAPKPATISEVMEQRDLRIVDNAATKIKAPKILIAGCGTGQHALGTAARIAESEILAIDLSLSSLSYAKRKTEEFGLENIEYMQADILDLCKINKHFDIIECVGVLHHMDDPMAGWRALRDCLKIGGLMKIGLYSELARPHIVKMRQEIALLHKDSSDQTMKLFRAKILESDKEHHKRIFNSPDIFTMSGLKDLLFHVQEHRFTIPQIENCLSELGLKFCGFEASNIKSNFKLKFSGNEDLYDLKKWRIYEEANPRTFAGMYQFWCQKVA